MKIRLSILALLIGAMLMTTGFIVAKSDGEGVQSVNGVNPYMTVHVGWVTEYVAGDHITIKTHDGSVQTFDLNGDIKILPKKRASELGIGSRVTVLARRNPSDHGWIAFGIVVHPAGSGAGSMPPTPTPTLTPTPTPAPI